MFGARRERTWRLVDGEAEHARHPRRFFIPDARERRALLPGARVRLGVERRRTRERLWVEVTAADGGAYTGRLITAPRRIDPGATVSFEPRHVLTIAYSPEELGYPPAEPALVERRILATDTPPDRVVRHDGRWLALIGEGDPDEEAARIALGTLTDRWPGLEEVFRSGDGDWRRDGERWRPADG